MVSLHAKNYETNLNIGCVKLCRSFTAYLETLGTTSGPLESPSLLGLREALIGKSCRARNALH